MRMFACVSCLLAIIGAGSLGGCTPAVTMPLTVDEYSLTALWDKTVELTDVQEGSAELGDFYFRIEADGRARLQYLYFSGRNQKGYPRVYRVDTEPDGEIVWHSSEVNFVTMTKNPRLVFEEIDSYGLAALPQGDDGCYLRIDDQWGGYEYSGDNMAIYELNQGELMPLDKVVFATNSPWMTINVIPMYIVGQTTDAEGHVSKHSSAIVNGENNQQIWFIPVDLNKAETVEYL